MRIDWLAISSLRSHPSESLSGALWQHFPGRCSSFLFLISKTVLLSDTAEHKKNILDLHDVGFRRKRLDIAKESTEKHGFWKKF